MRLPNLLFAVVTAPLFAVASCSVVVPGASDAGSAGDVGTGDADAAAEGAPPLPVRDGAACRVDLPGSTFTFHVHNVGARELGLAFGCGGKAPVSLVTPSGPLGIGPESANVCGFTCEWEYGSPASSGQSCSDCGPGVGKLLGAGSTVDIQWDRRVYTSVAADPQCVGGQRADCALAVRLAPSAAQRGTLQVCTGGASSGGPGSGYCVGSDEIAFTVDATQDGATIDVQ